MVDDREFRKEMIKKIHIAKADLGLDGDRYRALLSGVTGKESCKDMDLRELNAVYRQMEKDGFVVRVRKSPPLAPPRKGGDRDSPLCKGGDQDSPLCKGGDQDLPVRKGGDRDSPLCKGGLRGVSKRKVENTPEQKKIWAIWFALCDAGKVTRSTRALNAFIKRQTGIESIDWVKSSEDADRVIEGLKAIQKRVGARSTGYEEVF